MQTKLIILDRDGVINFDRKTYIRKFAHFRLYKGALEAIANLSKNGFTVAIATNQSAIGRKMTSKKIVDEIHQYLNTEVAKLGGKISTIAYCPHHPDDNCHCRKPKDGLFLQIAQKLNLALKGGFMVGDSGRDLIPAIKHQMNPVLVLTGKGKKTVQNLNLANLWVEKNLTTFTKKLIKMKK